MQAADQDAKDVVALADNILKKLQASWLISSEKGS